MKIFYKLRMQEEIFYILRFNNLIRQCSKEFSLQKPQVLFFHSKILTRYK